MPWVWTDELMQRLDADDRPSWVPVIGFRVDTEHDLDRLTRTIASDAAPAEPPPEGAPS